MKKTKPEVGQILYDVKMKPVTVTKVGRKYFYVKSEKNDKEETYHLDTWTSKSKWSTNELYISKEEVDKEYKKLKEKQEKERKRLKEKQERKHRHNRLLYEIREAFTAWNVAERNFSLEDLERIKTIIEER